VSDEQQTAARLLERFKAAKTREAALIADAERLTGWVAEARKALGNPYYYGGSRHGREGNAEKSKEKFSGYASHEVGLRFAQDLRSIMDELRTLKEELLKLREELRSLGLNAD